MTYKDTKQLVSIITPCYNDARFISECIESILKQDYPYIEHVIQDGASTDGTAELIKSYAERFPDKIKYVSEPDSGQSDGLDKAIRHSTGDILLVLNADDMLLTHSASWAIKNMLENPDLAVIYGDVYIIDENSKIIDQFVAHPYNFEKLLCVELIPPAQATFIRRTCLEKVGFYADSALDTCPDYEILIRLGLKFPMKHIPCFVTKYRRHTRPLDSKAERTVSRFINSKKLVMDRVFDSPRTPERLKKLRRRAYGGLNMWAMVTEVGLSNKKFLNLRAFALFIESARNYGIGVFIKNMWTYISIYSKRFVYTMLKKFLIILPRRVLLFISKVSYISDSQHALYSIQQKKINDLTISEKWQKLLCECLLHTKQYKTS